MKRRLLPTGSCWCGCNTPTEVGSFFSTGHDKRAESRVIKDVFGNVPAFLLAFGYGPESERKAPTSVGIACMLRLNELYKNSTMRVALEYTPIDDRTGPLRRLFPVSIGESYVENGSCAFTLVDGRGTIYVPFIDMLTVYSEGTSWVVRLRGGLDLGHSAARYVAVGYTPCEHAPQFAA